jgi:hypothetical protein
VVTLIEMADGREPRDRGEWVLLAYRIPRDPSTPRISVWRRLKRLGVAQLLDGLVALPLDSRTREALEWIAEEIVELGGEAAIWTARPTSRAQEHDLAARMAAVVAEQYASVSSEARRAAGEEASARRRVAARLRRELRRIKRRDYFPPEERHTAQAAVDELATALAEEVHA